MDYWKECIAEALEEAKLEATKEQIDTIVSWVEGAHENYEMSHGYECIANPLEEELEAVKVELEIQNSRLPCPKCGGLGIDRNTAAQRVPDSCWNCRGDGFIYKTEQQVRASRASKK